MSNQQYDKFIRERITELRLRKNISEYRLSLELGKSSSYIRQITSGSSMPSIKELFNIFDFFKITAVEFFAPMYISDNLFDIICQKLRKLDDVELNKIDTFINWLEK